MINLCTGGGLGEAVYLRAIVLHMLKRGESLKVFTRWPEFFFDLKVETALIEELTGKENVRQVSYPVRYRLPSGMDMFQKYCQLAGISEPVEFRIDWPVRNHELLDRIRREAAGRKVFVYQPLKRVNESKPWSPLVRPLREAYVKVLEQHADHYRIKLGHPPFVPEDREMPCELDLWGRAFIYDTFDVFTAADLCFGEPSFVGITAEAMGKRHICMFARAAQRSKYDRARAATPELCFHRKDLATAIYDG